MQIIYIIMIVLVLALIGAAHLHYRDKVGLAPHQERICADANTADCHHVDQVIVQAVQQKALLIAQADDAETFPVESGADIDTVYHMAESDLTAIGNAVASEHGIHLKRVAGNIYFDEVKTVNELILFLHIQQLGKQSAG